MNYYNEIDSKAAAWLRELIKRGLIPAGDVDTRSITEIKPHELTKYTQAHFFAGIGGWPLALRLAGWPEDRPVWTGSCPCQPFSTAGKGLGTADERHLWPVFADLIRECRPPVVFGEQVASAAGREWLAGVFADLEDMAYLRAGADLCAAGVGAPHIRQRLYWLADAAGGQCEQRLRPRRDDVQRSADHRAAGGLGNADRTGPQSRNATAEADRQGSAAVADGRAGGLADACGSRREGSERSGQTKAEGLAVGHAGQCGGGCWSRFDLIPCADGKSRRIESGLAPLAHGIPSRVVRLRGYGNAIVPQVAAEFVSAYLNT